jgi:hypothetical protein
MHAIRDWSGFEDDAVDGTNHERSSGSAGAAWLCNETGKGSSGNGGISSCWIFRTIRSPDRNSRTGLRRGLCSSADVRAGNDPADGLVGGSNGHDSAHWRSDVPHAGHSWHDGLGRIVFAGCSAAGTHPAAESVGASKLCASLRLAGQPRRPSLHESTSEQRARQAGGSAAAVDAEFAAGEGADIEPSMAKAGVGLAIFFDREQALPA